MNLGETLEQCVIRETREETGLEVTITGLLGICTDPAHVIAYADGEVRQEFDVAFYAAVAGGQSGVTPWGHPIVSGLPHHPSGQLR
ncbi:NUDIX domain-containing protein [Nocardia fluminea]|uniref:NUDIX domain-containing protein n=1 Tax=Nocardia fluminea TaxID=134984 RepID=UPI003829DCDC